MDKSVFIFDIGNVLIRWNPVQLAFRIKESNPAFHTSIGKIPQSREWEELDKGLLSLSNLSEIYSDRYPKNDIEVFLRKSMDSLTLIQKGWDIFLAAKKSGKRVYILSNMNVEFKNYLISKYPEFLNVDGAVYSCDVGCVKPELSIFKHLLSLYSIDPKDALFFDDKNENIESAQKLGIKSQLVSW